MVREEGYYFFILWKKIFDKVSFYFIRDFFAPQQAVLIFMAFFSDAGGHLDLGINLKWPKKIWSVVGVVLT